MGEVANLARALFVHHSHFFTFVYEEGVEPTNNVAERALRTAVQWRKIMFGNRSAEGELAVARLLTVTRTCQLQQLNVLAYLTAAIGLLSSASGRCLTAPEGAYPLNCYASAPLPNGSVANSWPLSIGGLYDTRFSPPVQLHHVFGGLLDEVEIFNVALTPDDVAAIFQAGSAGKCREVTICHKPGTSEQRTLTVPSQALSGHLNHGDSIGSCR